ncbi:MAG: pyrimidine dimer DNA glycosylase/endonuclease V [Bowdeniella nasicola]|nr:pyrimidine dimer DNA glycosylase/endonuclease V [Bowdeniella nasicola]
MRLWSLSPRLLDSAGLVACWRESLLALKVLRGRTRGYTRHPQLIRLRALDDPVLGVRAYLAGLADEADARGYSFNRRLIEAQSEDCAPQLDAAHALASLTGTVPVTVGQVDYEWHHLRAKLLSRRPAWLTDLEASGLLNGPLPLHPLFTAIAGDVEPWEIT